MIKDISEEFQVICVFKIAIDFSQYIIPVRLIAPFLSIFVFSVN